MKKLVLLGGGLAHAVVLKDLSARTDARSAEVEITVVAGAPAVSFAHGYADALARPSGSADDAPAIDIRKLCEAASVVLVNGEPHAVDLLNRTVTLTDGRRLAYDVLSICAEPEMDIGLLNGAEDSGHPLEPFAKFKNEFETFLAREKGEYDELHEAEHDELHLVQIGGGVGGCETALALASRLRYELPERAFRLTIIEQAERLVPNAPKLLALQLEGAFKRFKARIMLESRAKEVRKGAVSLDNGIAVRSDFTAIAVHLRPPEWVRELPLEHELRGYLKVDVCLRTSDPNVFASSSNVRALEEGEALSRNCMNLLRAQPPKKCSRPRFSFTLLSDSHGSAMGYLTTPFGRWPLPLSGVCLWLMRRLSLRFTRHFAGHFTDHCTGHVTGHFG